MAQSGNFKGGRERAAARRLQALELRKGGGTYRQIGQTLGVSEAQAHRDVQHALAALAKLSEVEAETVRALELARLDAILMPMMKQAKQGSQGAVDRVLRIMERRARLLGLDAPVRQEVSGLDGGPIAVKHECPDLSKLSDEELDTLAGLAQRLVGPAGGEGASPSA